MDPVDNVPFCGIADPVAAGTHFVAAVASVLGVGQLWRRSGGDPWRRFASSVFGASALLLFVASTAYHSASPGPLKFLLRRIDHASIYILVAGTFTAIVSVLERGLFRETVLALIWTFALAGVVLKLFFFGATPEGVDVAFYLTMGWSGIIPVVPVLRARTLRAGTWVFSAAGLYTFGALCELWGWPIFVPRVFGFHEVFHLSVMAANGCFYVFVLTHVVGRRATKPLEVPARALVQGLSDRVET